MRPGLNAGKPLECVGLGHVEVVVDDRYHGEGIGEERFTLGSVSFVGQEGAGT